ncbi:MAG TPA: hypothetical protein VFS47_12880, partial [Steroidobacteraceae bacterium]|nr:hypothetical protein [Steroidobacteraceae bacterium]
EIIRHVWPTTVVEESGLTRNVSLLRKCLGCVGGKYIENVPRRGYRFAGRLVEALDNEAAKDVPIEREDSPPEPTSAGSLPVLFHDSIEPHSSRWPHLCFAGIAVLLVSLALLNMIRVDGRRADMSLRAVQLTTNAPELSIISGAISPDGRYLAFGENTNLFVRQIGHVDTHRLQTPPHTTANFIDWFDDSSYLLVSGFDADSQRNVVWIACVLGGPPKIQFKDATLAKLSRTSRQMAFVRERNQLWLANADGTSPRLFATAENARVRFRPQFSDDDQYLLVAVERDVDARTQVLAYRLSDGARAVLFECDDDVRDMLLIKGDELIVATTLSVYEVESLFTKRHIDFVHSAAGAPRLLAEWKDAKAYSLQASKDGTRITAVKDQSQADVYIADLDDSGVRVSNVVRLTLDESTDRLSGWSDARTVLFHSSRSGNYGIYRQSIDDVRAEPVLVNERDNFRAVATPDLRGLWYFTSPPDLDSPIQLVRRPMNGGEPFVFNTTKSLARGVRCVASGPCVRMESASGQRVFYSFDPTDGAGVEIARTSPAANSSRDWDLSPDGTQLAVVDPAAKGIAVLDIQNVPVRRHVLPIPDAYPAAYTVSWDARSAGVYVVCIDEVEAVLLHVGLNGDSNVMLHRPNDPVRWVIPAPDGKHLAMQSWTARTNVWMLELAN